MNDESGQLTLVERSHLTLWTVSCGQNYLGKKGVAYQSGSVLSQEQTYANGM